MEMEMAQSNYAFERRLYIAPLLPGFLISAVMPNGILLALISTLFLSILFPRWVYSAPYSGKVPQKKRIVYNALILTGIASSTAVPILVFLGYYLFALAIVSTYIMLIQLVLRD